MPRSDYMRFLEILQNDNDERFGLSHGKYKPEGDRPEVLQMRVIVGYWNKIFRRDFLNKEKYSLQDRSKLWRRPAFYHNSKSKS